MTEICQLCIDCDDDLCCGKKCHKTGQCVITEDCFAECEDGIGGFIGRILIL